MTEEQTAELLAVYVDQLISGEETALDVEMTPQEREEIEALFQLSARLQRNLNPVQPSRDFTQALKDDLVEKAQRQIEAQKKRRKVTIIGAAALGSVVSIASLIGAIVLLVKRLKGKSRTQVAQMPS